MNRESRWFGYIWAFPATLIGGVFIPCALMSGGSAALVDGVIEVEGGVVRTLLRNLIIPKHGAAAMTLGPVVLGRDRVSLARTRRHERVHVRQYERWGPFFIPAYVVASGWALVRGRHPYYHNWFERDAEKGAR